MQNIGFSQCLILRPSFLDGERNEIRLGERIGITLANVFCKLPGLKKYHPIKAEVVAKALIEGLQNMNAKAIYESSEISELLS